jgi:hypothetical protein
MSVATLKKKINAEKSLFPKNNYTNFTSPPTNTLAGVNIVKNSNCVSCSDLSFDNNVFRIGPKTNNHKNLLTFPQNCCNPVVKTTQANNINSISKKLSELTKSTVYCNQDNTISKGFCSNNSKCNKKNSSFYKNLNTPGYDIYMRSLITKRSCFNNS